MEKYTLSLRWILQQNIQKRFYSSIVLCTFATNQPIPHMIPRNRHPTFASRVRRNIVEIVVRSLFFFSPCETLDQPENRVTFCSPESTPDSGIFFLWSPKFPKQHFFHFSQNAPPHTTQTVSHFFEAYSRPQVNTEKWKWQHTGRRNTWTCSTDKKECEHGWWSCSQKMMENFAISVHCLFSNYVRVAAMCVSSPLNNLCANMPLPGSIFGVDSPSHSPSPFPPRLHLCTFSLLRVSSAPSLHLHFFCSISALLHCFQPQNLVRT